MDSSSFPISISLFYSLLISDTTNLYLHRFSCFSHTVTYELQMGENENTSYRVAEGVEVFPIIMLNVY